MRQSTHRSWHSPAYKIVVAGMATLAISAVGATTTVPTLRTVTMNVAPLAAIDESSDTIGFADSDLYGMTPAQIDAQLDQMQAMGVNNVRVMIPWAGVEFYPGYYNWSTVDYVVNAADSRGMGVLGVINSTPFWATEPGQPALSGAPASPDAYGAFAGVVAERYAGKVGAYEIWNEPNAYMFYAPQPDPAGYTDLLKAAYPQIKAADPDATVIGGVVGSVVTYGDFTMNPIDFVDGIYAAGGQPYFDALSFHPYQYTTQFAEGGYLPDSPINQLAAMHDLMVANGDGSKLIWASEYGEPSSVAGEANQAAYLEDMLTTWRTLGYTGPSFVWTLQDRNTASTDPEDTFGVIRSDGTWKPAAYVIQELASQGDTTTARMAVALPDAQQAPPADLTALTVIPEAQTTSTTTTAPQHPREAVKQVAVAAPETQVVPQAKDVAIQRKLDRQSRRVERGAQTPSAPKAAADSPRRSAAAPDREPANVSKRDADKRERRGDDRRRDRHEGHRG
jgi:polysaccharide biosynthesis protein PslG